MARRRRSRARRPRKRTRGRGTARRGKYGTRQQPYAGFAALAILILVFGSGVFSISPYAPDPPLGGGFTVMESQFHPFNDGGTHWIPLDPGYPDGEPGYCDQTDLSSSLAEPTGWPTPTFDPMYGMTRECFAWDYYEPDSSLTGGPGTCDVMLDVDGDGDFGGEWWRQNNQAIFPVDASCLTLEDWSGDGTCDHRVFHTYRDQAMTDYDPHAYTHQYQGAAIGWVTIPTVPCMGWAVHYPY